MSEVFSLSPFEELIQSKLFTFHIGKDEGKKEFTVHSNVLAATSDYFRALVSNGMTESQKRSVEYPDVEPEDFARFLEYAYRYDYSVPCWVQDKTFEGMFDAPAVSEALQQKSVTGETDAVPQEIRSSEQSSLTPTRPNPDHPRSVWIETMSKSRINKKYKRMFRSDFSERNYLVTIQPKRAMLAAFEPQQNTGPEQDFTPIFLAHARLYTFACMRLVKPLKYLALHKLHKTLLGFSLYVRRVHDVVELARYAYRQGEDREYDCDGKIDELRKLVVDYIVREVATIGRHPAFLPLLHEGGDFAVDFWGLFCKQQVLL